MPTPGLVGQHVVPTFVTPVNGGALDATIPLSNDNTTGTTHNQHDADFTIHPQQSTLANRPVAGSAGRLWYCTDTNLLYFDTGSSWVVVQNSITGGLTVDTLAITTAGGGTINGSKILQAGYGALQTKSGNYAMAATDGTVIVQGLSSAAAITLPPNAPVGTFATVMRNDNSGNTLSVINSDGSTIFGGTTYYIGRTGEAVTFEKIGASEWSILSSLGVSTLTGIIASGLNTTSTNVLAAVGVPPGSAQRSIKSITAFLLNTVSNNPPTIIAGTLSLNGIWYQANTLSGWTTQTLSSTTIGARVEFVPGAMPVPAPTNTTLSLIQVNGATSSTWNFNGNALMATIELW